MQSNKRKLLLKKRTAIIKDYQTLTDRLINDLSQRGLMYVDLYTYINKANKLEIALNRIEYLLAVEY